MKNRRLILLVAFTLQATLLATLHGQVYSPRRLTQRIAPVLPPPSTPAAPQAAPQPAPGGGQAPPASPAVRASRDVTNASAQELRQAAPEKDDTAGKETQMIPSQEPPLLVRAHGVQPNPDRVLQFVDLSLTNTTAKAISYATLHFSYMDAAGGVLKEWTTRRELDPPLPAKGTTELNQPAYFMPIVTKRIEVKVEGIRFSDGTEWQPPS